MPPINSLDLLSSCLGGGLVKPPPPSSLQALLTPRDLTGHSAIGLRVPLEEAFRRGHPSEEEEDQAHSALAQDADRGHHWPSAGGSTTPKQAIEVTAAHKASSLPLKESHRYPEALPVPRRQPGFCKHPAIEPASFHSNCTFGVGAGLKSSLRRDATPGEMLPRRAWERETCEPVSLCKPLRMGHCLIQG